MRNMIVGAALLVSVLGGAATAQPTESAWQTIGEWKDGVLFFAGPGSEVGDFASNTIVFGLRGRACVGPISVENPEELFVVEGTFNYKYEGEAPIDMPAGHILIHVHGTKIEKICPVGNTPAVLVGVQHPPK